MTQVFLVIAPLFLIILASAVVQRFTNIDDSWSRVLNDLALYVGFPALTLSALSKTPVSMSVHGGIIAANSIFIVVAFGIAFFGGKILRLRERMFRTVFFCLGFGNVAYLGIPLLVQLFGAEILPTVSLIVAVYLFWIFTLGVGFLEFTRRDAGKAMARTILNRLSRNPLLLSVVAGLLIAGFGIPLPSVIIQTLDMLAASVTPMVLILLGLFVGRTKVGALRSWLPATSFSLVKLLALPAIFYFGVGFFGETTASFGSSIIEAAMPVAITPFALASMFDLDQEFIARSIVLSTMLSVVSIPFWVSLI